MTVNHSRFRSHSQEPPGYCCVSAMEFFFDASGFAVESIGVLSIGKLAHWLIDQLRPQYFPRSTVVDQLAICIRHP